MDDIEVRDIKYDERMLWKTIRSITDRKNRTEKIKGLPALNNDINKFLYFENPKQIEE